MELRTTADKQRMIALLLEQPRANNALKSDMAAEGIKAPGANNCKMPWTLLNVKLLGLDVEETDPDDHAGCVQRAKQCPERVCVAQCHENESISKPTQPAGAP